MVRVDPVGQPGLEPDVIDVPAQRHRQPQPFVDGMVEDIGRALAGALVRKLIRINEGND